MSHAPQQAFPWKHLCGFLRRFAVGVLLGLLVFFALLVLRHFEIPLIQQLERTGNDAIMRRYASHLAREDRVKAAAIVLNDTEDEESRISDLIDLITQLQSFDLSALVIDLQIKGSAASESGERLKRLARLLRRAQKNFPWRSPPTPPSRTLAIAGTSSGTTFPPPASTGSSGCCRM